MISFITYFLTFYIFFSIVILPQNNSSNDLYFYVGTYTNGDSKGIYLYKMDSVTGRITNVAITDKVKNPSFMAINKTGNNLYCVNEISDYEGTNSGSISAYRISPITKELELINIKSSQGADPCYVTVDEANKHILVSNYSGGSIALLTLDKSGALNRTIDVAEHKSFGSNKNIINKAHAHSIVLDNQNKFAYAADLGIDKIITYMINHEKNELDVINETQIDSGAGPRHLAIHQNGKYAYVINEKHNSIISFSIEEADGSLQKIESYSTLPDNFNEKSYCADIHIHPNGKFLYGSNRGHNSIVIYEIDEETGRLNRLGFESTQGNWPRNFAIDPTGNFILVANQKSNNIAVLKISDKTGLLNYTGISESVPSPACLLFYEKE